MIHVIIMPNGNQVFSFGIFYGIPNINTQFEEKSTMPRKEELYTNRIQPRYESLADANSRSLTAQQINSFGNLNDKLYMELGLQIQNNGRPEELGWVPRIFVMGRDGNGHDKVKTLREADLKVGSKEFWDQVQMGNVFAYPVGSEDPVQLQVKVRGRTRAELNYSKPMKQNELPSLPVQPVKWYHRALGFFHIGNYREMVRRHDQDLADYEANRHKLSQMKEGRKSFIGEETERHEQTYGTEKARIEAEEKARREEEEKERLRQEAQEIEKKFQGDVEHAIKHHGDIDQGIYQMTSVFQPVPQYDPKLEKLVEGKVGMNGKAAEKSQFGLYTKDHFNKLKVFDKDQIDLSKIKLGESGKTVSNEEFAAVTFFALWDNKNMKKAIQNHENEDIWAEKSLKDFGFSADQAAEIMGGQSRNWFTADLFVVPPRDNEGIYFEKTTNLGREDAVKAFQDYQSGDKTALAGIIAQGINKAATDLVLEQNNTFSEQTKGVLASTSLLVDIMKKDPDLEDLALKQGMEKDHLQAAKGMAELHRIQKERDEAEYKMAKAIQDGTAQNMTAEEKSKLLKPIIKGRLTQEQLVADNVQNCQYGVTKVNEMSNNGTNVIFTDRDTLNTWGENPKLRPEPGYKKIHFDTFNRVDRGIQKVLSPVSDTLKNLGTVHGPKHLDRIADEIIKQEGLVEKPVKELFGQLNEQQSKSKFNILTAASKAAGNIAKELENAKKPQQTEPVVNKNPELMGPGLG